MQYIICLLFAFLLMHADLALAQERDVRGGLFDKNKISSNVFNTKNPEEVAPVSSPSVSSPKDSFAVPEKTTALPSSTPLAKATAKKPVEKNASDEASLTRPSAEKAQAAISGDKDFAQFLERTQELSKKFGANDAKTAVGPASYENMLKVLEKVGGEKAVPSKEDSNRF